MIRSELQYKQKGAGSRYLAMTYRVVTNDGTAFIVEEADLELVKAYLALGGHAPISVEVIDTSSLDPDWQLHRT